MWDVSAYRNHLCAILLFLGTMSTLLGLKKLGSGKDTLESTNGTDGYEEVSTGYSSVVVEDNRKWNDLPNFRKDPARRNSSGNIYILGLFELSTSWGGERPEGYSEMLAARLAVKHVNDLNILPGYKLRLITNDTMCDPGVGIDRFFHALYSNKVILMLLGAGCSNVTESLANIVPYWNILQVSFGATSPVLSDRTKFPLFFRTVAPDSSHNAARVSFIKHFGWNTVVTLTLSQQVYLFSLNEMVNELENANISCLATITFSLENYKEQLQTLKETDTRIIVGSFSPSVATKVFCHAYDLNMYADDYVWLIRDHDFVWWNQSEDCDVVNLRKAVEGILLVSDYNFLRAGETSISGLTNDGFQEVLNSTVSRYAPQSYDAIWTMALTMQSTIKCRHRGFLNRFDYRESFLIRKFVDEIKSLNFIGVSGPVEFKGADRIGNTVFRQIQNGIPVDVAVYNAQTDNLDLSCRGCSTIKWQSGRIPFAKRILKFRLVTVSRAAFFFVLFLSSFGITMSLAFLYFNLHFRRITTVKLSSPRLNNFIVLGCVLVYLAVILLGLDRANFFLSRLTHFCALRIYLLCAGFSLTFGSIFAKTYRVHRIFTYSGTSLLKDKLLKDKKLIGLIFVLLIIDGFILALWTFFDPMAVEYKNLTLESNVEDHGIVYQTQVEVCRSRYTMAWYIAIYSYKGFLLVVGVYMAWETRRVKIPSLNDSQYIGLCVYSVITSTVVVFLVNFLSYYISLSYLITAVSIYVSTTIILVQLFMPKFKSVFMKDQDQDDSIIGSVGLKFEYNTRRLIFDDHRETLYRLEVQNRVYKNELDSLDREITRLEDLLARSSLTGKCDHQEPFIIASSSTSVPYSTVSTTRASWPSSSCQRPSDGSKAFLSERKLVEKQFEKARILDRLKKFIGSIPSVWTSRSVREESDSETPQSVPEIYEPDCAETIPPSSPGISAIRFDFH